MSNPVAIKMRVEKKYDLFAETVQAMSAQEIKDSLLRYAKHKEEVNHFLKTNEEIKAATEKVARLSEPFNKKIKEYKAKISQLKNFIDDNISKEELDKVMSEYARLQEQENLRKMMDRDLHEAKSELNMLKGSSQDTLRALKDKMAYLNIVLNDIEGDS